MSDQIINDLNNKISDLHAMVARIDERTENTSYVLKKQETKIEQLSKAQYWVAGCAAGIMGFISNLPIIKGLFNGTH